MPEPKRRKTLVKRDSSVKKRASCRVASVTLDQIKANLAEIQPQNHQNVKKCISGKKFQESAG